jgi:hypothetical protein
MQNVVIFYDYLEYFTAIWHNLWPVGIVCGHLVYVFVTFWYVWIKKTLATLLESRERFVKSSYRLLSSLPLQMWIPLFLRAYFVSTCHATFYLTESKKNSCHTFTFTASLVCRYLGTRPWRDSKFQ